MEDKDRDFLKGTPLTTIARHYIKAGAERQFEQWVLNMEKKASGYDGFLGRYLIPPKSGDASNEYIVVFQFENLEKLTAWMDSKEREIEVEKLREFSEGQVDLEHVEGIEFWFSNPKKEASKKPPTWKMALLTWVAVFAGVMLLPKLFKFLLPSFSPTIITLIVTLVLVALMTWVLMPAITRLFKKWLFK